MSLHASVPHCTILGANLMATLTGKKAKKQRAQRHVLQETQLNKAQTGQAALEHVNRDPSLTALLARVTAIQALMRRLKTAAYWSLVLDPQSFSSTVENMFAVAIIMDLALIQIVEDEDTGVAIVNWEFKEDDKEVDDEVLLGRIGDQGLNEEEVAQELEQAARTAMLFLMILRSLLVFICIALMQLTLVVQCDLRSLYQQTAFRSRRSSGGNFAMFWRSSMRLCNSPKISPQPSAIKGAEQ